MKYIVSMQECDVLGVNANAVDDNFNAIWTRDILAILCNVRKMSASTIFKVHSDQKECKTWFSKVGYWKYLSCYLRISLVLWLSGLVSIQIRIQQRQHWKTIKENLMILFRFRDAIHTHFATLIGKWTIVGGWVKHRADKRGKVAKGRHPYPLCHAYRQMDDCGWVGQASGR